ncbi:MAG: MFS transporter [Spirochaetes bacterium RBG_16_49_21]|nr:MAG: MFS transporter [Spirochaetes bacterium RBG_16_49_21]
MSSSSASKPASPNRFPGIYSAVRRLAAVERGELWPLFWAFAFFFALLCAYYIIRPIRDEMGIAGGVEHLQWMFSATFLSTLAVVPLFGWVTRRFAVKQFLPYVYSFLIGNLLLFYILFMSELRHEYVARAFFIWVSVFNLFIVSVFWSLMVDIFTSEQAKRLFGVIAAGGTAGALAGPALTAVLVIHIGTASLLLISALFLGWALVCINRLIAGKRSGDTQAIAAATDRRGTAGSSINDKPMGGGIFAGIRLVLQSSYLAGICLLMLLYTALATFLYFHQAHIVRDSIGDPAGRTALFASMDFSVNAITLAIQIFLSSRVIRKFGLAGALLLAPLILGTGLLTLWAVPVLAVVVAVQILQRAGNYAIMRPAREILFVVVGTEEKYKAKNFIDTVVYRAGDLSSAWIYAGLQALGMAASGIALFALPLAGACAWLSFKLSRRQEKLAKP